jgi:hypothetical protein
VHTPRKKRRVFPEESEGGSRIAFWARSCNGRVPAAGRRTSRLRTRVRPTSPSGFDDPRAPRSRHRRRLTLNLVSCFAYPRLDHHAAFRHCRGKLLAAYTESVERMLLFCSLSWQTLHSKIVATT